jgi:hypothetical protein
MTLSNIEPLARAIAERIYQQNETSNPTEMTAWVDAHWQCAAAELEVGRQNDDGSPIPGVSWELGLAAYLERMNAKKQELGKRLR